MPTTDPLILTVAAIVLVFGVGRLTRLLVHDDFPPVVWLRYRWDVLTRDGDGAGPWSALVHCGFCAGPWLMAGAGAWGWFSGLHWTWWAFFTWLALSYLASIVVAWDQPPDDE